jgi:hypothetical protein
VGAASTNDIRYQNPNPSVPSGLIKSICNDSAGNLSSIAMQYINVDWTNPVCNTVNDGTGADIDTSTSLSTLSANWAASVDSNSGIATYWYAIGTTPGGTNVLGWTSNGTATSVTNSALALANGQTYYFSVKTVDGAGLSSICTSDGDYVDSTVGIKEYSGIYGIKAFPNPSSGNITVTFGLRDNESIEISLIDKLGRAVLIKPKTILPKGNYTSAIDASSLGLAAGTYTLKIAGEKESTCMKLVILP